MSTGAPPRGRVARRALWAAVLFSVGICIARSLPGLAVGPAMFLGSGALAMLAIVAGRGARGAALLSIACVGMGLAVYGGRAHTVRGDSILRFLPDAPALMEVEGVVASTPMMTRSQRGSLASFARYDPIATRFTLRCTRMMLVDGGWRRVTGRLLVRVSGEAGGLNTGDRVVLTGLASRFRSPGNPGGFDAPAYYAQQDVRGRMSLASPGLIEIVDASRPGIVEGVRAEALSFLDEGSADRSETRALLAALLLGQRDDDIGQTGPAFRRLGIAHILAISGLHLGLVAGAMVLLLRLTGDHPRLESLVVLVTLIAALVLIPARAPILRAALMLGAFLGAECAGRRYDRLNTLALVAIAVLVWRPSELFSAGFQLSFGAVAALLVITPILRERLFGERDLHAEDHLGRWVLSGAKTTFAASLCAWGVTTPLAAYHFGVFTPFGAPATVLLSIPVALTLVAGYASMIVSAAVPALEATLHDVVFAMGGGLRAMVLALDARAWAVVSLPRLSIPWTVAATGAVVWWMVRGSWRDGKTIALTAIVAAWTGWRILGVSLPAEEVLRVDALDVGDGSCYLMRSGDEAVMFDCGSTWFGMGESSIPQAVRALGSAPVRTVIVSHADTDHYSALLDAAGPMGVRRVVTTQQFLDEAAGEAGGASAYLLRELAARGIEVRTVARGDTIGVGDVAMDVLWPPGDAAFAKDNDASIVLMARVPTDGGERTVLLTGDIERDAMDGLMPSLRGVRVDAMEAPHHGSAREFAADFVMTLDPGLVVQSTGFTRVDDPRWAGVREGRAWFATARDGAVTIRVMRTGAVVGWAFRSGGDGGLPD